MNEWEMVSVVVTLTGLITAIAAPLVTIHTKIARINTTVDKLEKNVETLAQQNRQEHTRVWELKREQDRQVSDINVRLTVVERMQKLGK